MATAYELAFLSNLSYSFQPNQQTRVFEISKKANDNFQPKFLDSSSRKTKGQGTSIWAIIEDVGLNNNMYCAKFKNLKNNQIVYAFRGTRGPNLQDIGVDVMHLWSRKSPYINAAKSYLKSRSLNNAIITGHSLGGFIAVSMAYYFPNLRIAVFNAPHVYNPLSILGDWWDYFFKNDFRTNKIIYYESNVEKLASFTRSPGHDASIFLMDNVKMERVFFGGLHGLQPMLKQLRKREGHINWNAKF